MPLAKHAGFYKFFQIDKSCYASFRTTAVNLVTMGAANFYWERLQKNSIKFQAAMPIVVLTRHRRAHSGQNYWNRRRIKAAIERNNGHFQRHL
jgi:hypothetical protein